MYLLAVVVYISDVIRPGATFRQVVSVIPASLLDQAVNVILSSQRIPSRL